VAIRAGLTDILVKGFWEFSAWLRPDRGATLSARLLAARAVESQRRMRRTVL